MHGNSINNACGHRVRQVKIISVMVRFEVQWCVKQESYSFDIFCIKYGKNIIGFMKGKRGIMAMFSAWMTWKVLNIKRNTPGHELPLDNSYRSAIVIVRN